MEKINFNLGPELNILDLLKYLNYRYKKQLQKGGDEIEAE